MTAAPRRASGNELQDLEWRDPATAPLHTSIIVCCWYLEDRSSPFVAEAFLDWDGTWRFTSRKPLRERFTDPTGWMPMPAPQKAPPPPS